jgi:hypothetical protein
MGSFGVFITTLNSSNSGRITLSGVRTRRDHLFTLSVDRRQLLYIGDSRLAVSSTYIILVNQDGKTLFSFRVIGRDSNAFILSSSGPGPDGDGLMRAALGTLQENNAFIQNIFFEDDEGVPTNVIRGFIVFER